MLRVRVVTPSEVVVDTEASKVIAEGKEGSFCLLPGHANYLAALVPGIVAVTDLDERVQYLAVDEGMLVKCGDQVSVSCRHAVLGPELEVLRETIRTEYHKLDEQERYARSEIAKLEANFVRRFIDHQKV